MATFSENLFAFLTADAGLAGLTADGVSPQTYRIFPGFSGENPKMPCIAYRVISAVRGEDFDGPDGYARTRVQIDSMADSYTAAEALADAARRCLDGFSGAMGSMDCWYARLDDEVDFYEGQGAFHRRVQDFIITHTEES